MEILFSIKAVFSWIHCKSKKKEFQPVQWLETTLVFSLNDEWREYDTPTWLRRGICITGRNAAARNNLLQSTRNTRTR